MDDNSPIKYSDLISPDSSIKDLNDQLAELATTYRGLMDGIKAQAVGLKNALGSVSGASASGQQAIKESTALVEKLRKKEVQLQEAKTETAKKIAEVAMETQKQNNQTKLSVKLAKAQEGSYEALSAEYSLLIKQYQTMGNKEKENIEEVKSLEDRIMYLRLEMKKSQEAIGSHVLSVGDYGIATATLASDIRNGIQALTQMRIEMMQLEEQGQKGSDRWNELSQNAQKLSSDLKDLKKQYQIVKLETNALGQQTGLLNDAIGVLSTGAGGLSALTGTVNMFGGSAAGAAESLVKLNSAMAIANGVSQIYNGIFKQANILLAIRKIQTNAVTAAQNLQTKSTIGATVAQKVLNVVAMANPYVLLAAAIAAVVGGLILWAGAGARAAKVQKDLNRETEAELKYLKALDEERTRSYRENQTAYEQETAIAKARKDSNRDVIQLEKQAINERWKANQVSKKIYEDEINNLENNRKEVMFLEKEIERVSKEQGNKRVHVAFETNGPIAFMKAEEAAEILQKKLENLREKVDIPTTLIADEKQIRADAAQLKANYEQLLWDEFKTETSLWATAEKNRAELIDQRFDRERALAKKNTESAIKDLQIKLQEDKNLTLSGRKAVNDQILSLQKKLELDLRDIDNKENKANLDATRDLENAKFNILRDSSDKKRALLKTEYDRQVQDIQFRLATERDLTEEETESLVQQMYALWYKYLKDKEDLENEIRVEQLNKEAQSIELELELVSEGTKEAMELRLQAIENRRQVEIAENKLLAEDMRQDEAAINAKYDRIALQEAVKSQNDIEKTKLNLEQQYAQSEFDLRMHSSREINKFQLKQEKERIRQEIELQKRLLETQTGEEKENTEKYIKTLRNRLKKIDMEIQAGVKVNNIWELFGFNSEGAEAIQTITDQILNSLQEITQARIDAADKAVEAAEKEVEAAQKVYEYELEAKANGYANSVDTAEKELKLARQEEQKALKIKEEAQREQERINSLTQLSSLITASANIWAAFGGIFPAGPALAAAGIAAMFLSFAAAKVRAKQISQESYGEGTVELLKGGSHQSGNDIDLGRREDGTRRRAEGGEFFAVVNKRNSRKFRDVIPDVINSLNDGSFGLKYLSVRDNVQGIIADLSPVILNQSSTPTNISGLERDVRAIRRQREEQKETTIVGKQVVIKYKNLTQKISLC